MEEKQEPQQLMMVDRLDVLHFMMQMQMQTIEHGYVRATMEKII